MPLTSDIPVEQAAPQRAGPPGPDDPAALKVVPVRHPWRWAAIVVTAVLIAQFVHGLVTNPAWEWAVFAQFFTAETVLKAVWVTLQLTVYGTALGFALGVVLAFMRLSGSPEFGIPFGPGFFHVDTMGLVGAMGAAVLGLALHQAAYAAEIVRGGVLAVDGGQLEAAAALGIPRLRQLRRIVLPQAMRSILPNATNEVISLFKGTSIVSVMAIGELFYQVQVIYGRNGRVVPLLMVATAWYVLLTTVLSVLQHYVERHFSKGATR
ncbi:amino acid ABC transporter permease [Streptomyces nigrescens]